MEKKKKKKNGLPKSILTRFSSLLSEITKLLTVPALSLLPGSSSCVRSDHPPDVGSKAELEWLEETSSPS